MMSISVLWVRLIPHSSNDLSKDWSESVVYTKDNNEEVDGDGDDDGRNKNDGTLTSQATLCRQR